MYRLPQSVSGTLIILPLRKSDKENRYRGIFEHAILSLADKLHLQFVHIDSFMGGNKEAVVLHLCHPRLHQFFEC